MKSRFTFICTSGSDLYTLNDFKGSLVWIFGINTGCYSKVNFQATQITEKIKKIINFANIKKFYRIFLAINANVHQSRMFPCRIKEVKLK